MDAHEAEYRGRLQAALGPDFELRELIGRGGFGAVYSAWDRKLERDVAVKALRHDLFPTPVVLERFQREAKSLAQLRHAHVLPVYEVGVGDGLAFMVMPFIKGDTLGALLRRGETIPAADAVRFTVEIARALDAAHRAGIVHRDVKPDNILIEGPDRHAVLSDFGIAKAGASELTGSGVAIGSPQYMSPEQAAAERDVDGRSDIYSLGAVAYEMLAGRRPYEANSLQRLLILQFTTEPTPLSTLARGTSASTVDAIMRALARDPAARWRTAGEFARALTSSAPAPVPVDGDSWFARRAPLLALLNLFGSYIAIVFLVVAGAGASAASGFANAIALLRSPFLAFVQIVLALSLIELLVTVWRARPTRPNDSWLPALRAAFGQPRWWQAWYPAELRSPDNAWESMPSSVKALRTLLWIELVSLPLAIPLIFFVPELQRAAAGAGLALPLPARIVIALSAFMQKGPGYAAYAGVILGVAWLAISKHVRVTDVLRLLLTWRREAWEAPLAAPLREPRAQMGSTASEAPATAVGPRSWRWIAIAALVAAVAFIARNFAAGSRPASAVAVLPCENVSGDSTTDYLAEGLSDEVRSGLAGLPGVNVMARASSLVFRGAQPDLRRIASSLRVGAVLQCSVRARAGQLRVTAELVRVPEGVTRWAHTFIGNEASFQLIRDSISRALAAQLGSRGRQIIADSGGTADREAYSLFLKGEFHRRKNNLPAAIDLLRRSVARDPGFARAHAGLAAAYAGLPSLGFASPDSTRPLAEASAARALALDPMDVLARMAQGMLAAYDLRLADADRVFAGVLDRDSLNAEAMFWRSGILGWVGRLDEALRVSLAARRLDPLSADVSGSVAYIQFSRRQFRAAIDETRPALDVDPNYVIAVENLAVAYAFAGQPDSAVAAARRAIALGASNYGGRAYLMFAFAAAGHWREADEQRRLLAAEGGNSRHFNQAFTDLVYGRRARAIAELEASIRAREPLLGINFIACDPMWDPLKADPRFAEMLSRLGAVACPPLPTWPIGKRP